MHLPEHCKGCLVPMDEKKRPMFEVIWKAPLEGVRHQTGVLFAKHGKPLSALYDRAAPSAEVRDAVIAENQRPLGRFSLEVITEEIAERQRHCCSVLRNGIKPEPVFIDPYA